MICILCKGHTCPGGLVSLRLSTVCTHAQSSNTCSPFLFLQATRPLFRHQCHPVLESFAALAQQALNLKI